MILVLVDQARNTKIAVEGLLKFRSDKMFLELETLEGRLKNIKNELDGMGHSL